MDAPGLAALCDPNAVPAFKAELAAFKRGLGFLPEPPDVAAEAEAVALQAIVDVLRAEMASIRQQIALRKSLHPPHFDPTQPRVPAGNPDGGEWTSGNRDIGAASTTRRLAYVIRVCVLSGVLRSVDAFGNKAYKAIYDCPGDRSVIREGAGHDVPGLIRDRFH
jgi:hypothetical protein